MRSQGRPASGCGALRCNGSRFKRACVASLVSRIRRLSSVRTPEADFSLVHTMCEVIRHRGPDDEGVHVEPGVGLGMRRLSIIDLSTGHQPIHNEDGRSGSSSTARSTTTASCARELEAAGHRFYTSSDTETIVHAYEEWGEDGVRAAARHVRHRASGIAARGRCCWRAIASASSRCTTPSAAAGCTSGPRSSRCSRAGAVDRATRSRRRSITTCRSSTRRAIASIFKGVSKLPPGPSTCAGATAASTSSGTGRSPPHETFRGIGARRPRRRCASVLADAVRSHMVSDVPLGAFLSGGVDSSVVVGLMARGVEPAGQDVLDRLRRAGSSTSSSTRARVAEHFGTEHHEFVVRPDGARRSSTG